MRLGDALFLRFAARALDVSDCFQREVVCRLPTCFLHELWYRRDRWAVAGLLLGSWVGGTVLALLC